MGRHKENVTEDGWRAKGDGRPERASERICTQETINFSLTYIWCNMSWQAMEGTTVADWGGS